MPMRPSWIKSALGQFALAAIVIGAFLAIWILYVPSARPWLEKAGIADMLGLPPAQAAEADGGGGRGFGGGGSAKVVAAEVGTGTLNDRITAIGDGRALRSVSVRAEANGRITDIGFRAGEQVEEGTVIFRLDDQAEAIALDRARLVLADAQEDADRVGAQEELAVISDRSEIQIDFRVPERLLAKLRPGMPIEAEPLALPGEKIAGEIVAIDNMVDRNSRTVRLLAQLHNDGDRLRDGMSLSVTLAFTGDPYPTVDPLAVQWSSEGAFVWVVRDGKAARVPVDIRQRNAGAVLVEGALQPGEMVVIEGVQTLRPGAEVAVQGEAAAMEATAVPARKS